MGWLLAIGCYAAIFSPAAVLLLTVVGRSYTLVVLMLGAAFVWLISISLVAALWAALAHLKAHTWLLVLYAVPAQEGARYLTYAGYMRLLRGLDAIGMRPAATGVGDDGRGCMPAAIAAGLGFGLTQALVFYGDVLWHASQPGSMYSDACAHLSTFAVDALTCGAMLLLNVLLSLLGWAGAYPCICRRHARWVRLPCHRCLRVSLVNTTRVPSSQPVIALLGLHYLASTCTLLNDTSLVPRNGCVGSLPGLLITLLLAANAANAALKAESGGEAGRRLVHASSD